MGTKPAPKLSDETSGGLSSATAATQGFAASTNLDVILEVGTILGGRYEILEMLGIGGMGAVYKARDRELDRVIALKVVRPDLARNPEILQRFKQELLTARQVTHKNVIRIFDLAEADGIKFITMEYVAGPDLRRLLADHGKLPPAEAVDIIQQVSAGVAAAHAEGVIHRDLKPGNILRDAQGRVVVMDFGLARTITGDGMTKTGAMLGTVEYMSPEQAKAEKLDARSDLFTIGLILYELLTGKTPYHADSAIASLLKRTQEPAIPAYQVDPDVPRALSDILGKALERDPNQRYQSVQEFVDRLEEFQGKRPVSHIPVTPASTRQRWMLIAAVVAVLVVAAVIAASVWRARSRTTAVTGPHRPVSVLVADFTNHTGDPVFDGTLEPMFNVALEGASFINAYNRGEARKLAQKLPNPSDKLDEQPARLVALSQGISAVVSGEISRRGDSYNISAIVLDAVTGNVLTKAEATAGNKDEVLGTVPKLAAPIRKALGDSTPEAVQLQTARGAFTAASLEVVHQYGVAMEQQFAGKTDEALKSFAKTAELDPNFARAYSGMTSSAIKLDRQGDAQKYIKSAMEHVDRMTDRERYRVRGLYYGAMGDWQKCAEEYSDLVKQYPVDNIGYNNLAYCLAEMRELPKAVEEARRDVEMNPHPTDLSNLSLFLSYAGDFQSGEAQAREVQKKFPSYESAYLALALAQLGQGQLSQTAETYSRLEKLNAHGASMAAWGFADLALYQGRFADAVRLLEQGASSDLAAKNKDAAAEKFAKLAYAQVAMQRKAPAIAAADKALANSQTAKIRFLAAQIFAEAGQIAKAQKIAAGLASELQPEAQADAKIIDGDLALQHGDARGAVKAMAEANKLIDTWFSRFELGRAYLAANAFAEADAEFDRCLKRRGEALSLFLDEVPTYGYFPPVYYYQARAREGLKSPGFAESYRNYLAIRGQAGEDPLLPEIHRRSGK